jgi:hypothetical protein
MKKPKQTYSRKLIKDEFTPLPVSRGRKWQLRRVKAGLCVKCSGPVVPGQELCLQHMLAKALARRKKLNSPRQNKGKWVDAAAKIHPQTSTCDTARARQNQRGHSKAS